MNQNQSTPPAPQMTSPIPQQQSTQQTTPQGNSNKKLIIIVIAVILGFILIVGGILAATVVVNLNSAKDKAKDAQIKSQLLSVEAAAAVYYDDNGTLIGLEKDPKIINIQNSVKQYNSELIFQTITKDNFIGYAKLPSSGKLFCVGPISTNESSTGTCTFGEGMKSNNINPAPTFPPLK
ncbi:MAG: hypothetical protein M1429_00210 [Patescibacteria group bacterium]|nr:hypothetical protein [Patescibacteria group bacterium]